MSRSVSIVAVLCAMAVPLTVAERSWGKEKLTAEEKIEKELSRPTTFEFMDTPLQEVVVYLGGLHHINIILDKKALSNEGLDPETPITFGLKGVKLRSALNLMLRDLDLAFAVQDEVLVITTETAARAIVYTKIYTVNELVENCDENLDALCEIITTCVAPETWSDAGGEGSIHSLELDDENVLVISQSYAAHHQIATLLDELQDVADR